MTYPAEDWSLDAAWRQRLVAEAMRSGVQSYMTRPIWSGVLAPENSYWCGCVGGPSCCVVRYTMCQNVIRRLAWTLQRVAERQVSADA